MGDDPRGKQHDIWVALIASGTEFSTENDPSDSSVPIDGTSQSWVSASTCNPVLAVRL